MALISNGLINQARKQAESNLRSVRKSVLEDNRPVSTAQNRLANCPIPALATIMSQKLPESITVFSVG